MRLELYLWDGARRMFLEAHHFYVDQLKGRVFSQFEDIEEQAGRYCEEVYNSIGIAPGHGDVDMSDAAEWAYEEAASHYFALANMREQILLGGLAGMYHEWDKQLREFIGREMHHYVDSRWIDKHIWKPAGDKVLELLEEFGWPLKSLPLYAELNALRLVVNVYKHGKGPSLIELADKHPNYVIDPVKAAGYGSCRATLDHEWLAITDEQFDAFAAAISDFWSAMPERLYYEVTIDGVNPFHARDDRT